MLRTKHIYEITKQRYLTLLSNLNFRFREREKVTNNILEQLTVYELLIENHSNFTFKDLCTNSTLYKELGVKHYSRTEYPIELTTLKVMFELYFESVEELRLVKNKLRDCSDFLHTIKNFLIYRSILIEFNSLISDKIIKGYSHSLGNKLSIIRIARKERRVSTVNWGESNKIKAKLLAEGRVPKNKDNPTGENWLVMRTTEFTNFWQWRKHLSCVDNYTMYTFKPTQKFTESNAVMLHHYVQQNPNIVHHYHLIKSRTK